MLIFHSNAHVINDYGIIQTWKDADQLLSKYLVFHFTKDHNKNKSIRR